MITPEDGGGGGAAAGGIVSGGFGACLFNVGGGELESVNGGEVLWAASLWAASLNS